MATVTGLTAARMIEMENATVVDGNIVGTDLILVTRDGTPINAGSVLGPPGPPGPTFIVCTSTTRPTVGPTEEGKAIYETDTKLVRIWTGTRWRAQEKIICTSTTRPVMDTADKGTKIFETDTNVEYTWTGTSWAPTISMLFPIGYEMTWPGQISSIPTNFIQEDGRVLLRADYPKLFEVLGTTWNQGGELATQFRIPESRDRVFVGAGLGYGVGTYGGANQHTLKLNEMAAHVHQASGPGVVIAGPFLATFNIPHDPASLIPARVADAYNTSSVGGNVPHNNMQSFAAKLVIIRAQ